ncbi:nuclear pore complex protein Nup98-Nup96 [Anabrus simplex]|uniref:nuclear pore complex protein Nup98-Nup96 n=1 Tax=Anabrus simplex TaxID=316456 RepID=UPI0034DDA247
MNSPFGQSTFGKTTTSGFTAPAFGSTGTSLFGSNTSTAGGGLFGGGIGTPVFGQAQTTQPSAFGFGTNTTSTNLFGNQQNANTSLFGGTTTSAFGANKPTFGGFGSPSTSLFGQQQQPQATTSLFGQPSGTSTSGIFGSSGGFGSNTTTQTMGTPIKFIPATGTDTMVKSGVTQTINTRHHCITCMKEYEAKSLEELRLEDYMLNRKGPQQAPQQSGLFGTSTQPSLFGSAASTSTGGGGLFQDKPLFGGGTTMGFGSGTGVFGSSNQQSGSLFGKPAGFGAATTTTGTGFSFNTTTTSNPFGTSTQPKPFGAVAPQTNLFGATTSQPSTFGTQTTGFGGFGTPQTQSINLFSQNKSPFNMATTTTGFSFGQNTATNQTSSLFGKPTTTPGFGTFGSNPTTTGGFGSGNMFGSNQNTLFNQSFGKTTTSGFSFGQSAPTSTGLGTGLNLGGQTLFGTNNKPGGLFGTSTGMFGAGTSSFGNSTTFGGLGSGLGTSLSLGGNTLMGGTGGISSTNQQGNVSSIHDQILALASMPFGDTPLFRNLLPVTGKTDELLKSNAAPKTNTSNNQLKVTPRGTSKLRVKPLTTVQPSKKALFAGLEEDGLLDIEPHQVPRTSTKRLMLKPSITASLSNGLGTFGLSENDTSAFNDSNKENENFADISNYNGNVNQTDRSPEKDEERKTSDSGGTSGGVDAFTETTSDLKSLRITRSLTNDNKENSNASITTSEESQEEDSVREEREDQPRHPTGIVLNRVGYYTIPSLDELTSLLTEDGKCIVDNFTVGREGYGNVYFPDSFDVSNLNLDEIVHFRHKEIVLYPDDTRKPPVGEGLNRKAQVTLDRVWPIDKTLHEPITDPERLAEMNYEAKLQRVCAKLHTRFLEYRPQTGSWVFKVDHFSKYGLSDSDDDDDTPAGTAKQTKLGAPSQNGIPLKPSVARTTLQSSEHLGGKQVPMLNGDLTRPQPSLVPVLLEDDHDMEEGPRRQNLSPDDSLFLRSDFDHIQQSPTAQIAKELGRSSHNVQLMKAAFFMRAEMERDEEYIKLAQFEDEHPVRLEDQVSDVELDEDIGITKLTKKNLGLFRTQFSSPQPVSPRPPVAVKGHGGMLLPSAVVPEPVPITAPMEHPKTVVLKYPHHVLHWEKTTAHRIRAACLADLGLFKGCSFRVGWGSRSTFVTLTTQQTAGIQPLAAPLSDLNSYVSGRPAGDNSPCIVQRLRVAGGDTDYESSFSATVEGHLEIELQHSEYSADGDCPFWKPEVGVDSLHAHCDLAKALDSGNNGEREQMLMYSRQVWELCVALWGRLPTIDENSDPSTHLTTMVRKNAVSEWLESVVLPYVKRETSQILGQIGNPDDKEHHVPAILSYLSAKNLMEACEKAQNYGDHYAALLLAQVGGGLTVRQFVQQQLKFWQDVEADAYINPERLKFLMLVAGIPLFSSTHGTINVCENLDWKRAFALHLWYICSPVSSITDALHKYEASFDNSNPQDVYAKCPDPPYLDESMLFEANSSHPVYDLCYHLLKLYSARSYPLDRILNPATHTPDPLDYRLSWLLQQILDALGYSHLSDHSAAHLHTSFAMQLESRGLWHWGVFVLLHLRDPLSRRAAVLDLLGRHVELSDSERYLDKEDFLIEKLHVPAQWIYQAKATLAVIQKEYSKAAWYLMKSGQLNEGHEIIMKHIAADAIINENYKYLKCLLKPLVEEDPENTVSDWNNGGQILWDYIQIIEEIDKLKANPNLVSGYQLEKLQPQLSSLCSRIRMLPCPTARHRLCQSEIAVRTTYLVRTVSKLQNGKEEIPAHLLTRLVTQLPLPEDRVRDELNLIVESVVEELISH